MPDSHTGYIPGAGIPLQKQLEHANQQSGFTDAVRESDIWMFSIASVEMSIIMDDVIKILSKCCFFSHGCAYRVL